MADRHYIYVMEETNLDAESPVRGRLDELGLSVITTEHVHAGGVLLAYHLVAVCADFASAGNVHRLLDAAGTGGTVVPSQGPVGQSNHPER